MASLFRSTARLARPSLNNNIALARSDHGEWKVGSVRFFFLSFSLARPRGGELRARCWRKARAWLLGRRRSLACLVSNGFVCRRSRCQC
jgi:hypothetical protein